jgi:hypothetical protein
MSVHVDTNRYRRGTGDSRLGDGECRHPDPDPERSGKTLGLAMTHSDGWIPGRGLKTGNGQNGGEPMTEERRTGERMSSECPTTLQAVKSIKGAHSLPSLAFIRSSTHLISQLTDHCNIHFAVHSRYKAPSRFTSFSVHHCSQTLSCLLCHRVPTHRLSSTIINQHHQLLPISTRGTIKMHFSTSIALLTGLCSLAAASPIVEARK